MCRWPYVRLDLLKALSTALCIDLWAQACMSDCSVAVAYRDVHDGGMVPNEGQLQQPDPAIIHSKSSGLTSHRVLLF